MDGRDASLPAEECFLLLVRLVNIFVLFLSISEVSWHKLVKIPAPVEPADRPVLISRAAVLEHDVVLIDEWLIVCMPAILGRMI